MPVGSVKKGEELVTTGAAARPPPARSATAPELKGLGQVPAITGRSPMYIYRQLNDIKIGTRNGEWMPLMKGVVDKLSDAGHDRDLRLSHVEAAVLSVVSDRRSLMAGLTPGHFASIRGVWQTAVRLR